MVVLGPRRGRARRSAIRVAVGVAVAVGISAAVAVGISVAAAVGFCRRALRMILCRAAVGMSRAGLGTLLLGDLADAFTNTVDTAAELVLALRHRGGDCLAPHRGVTAPSRGGGGKPA